MFKVALVSQDKTALNWVLKLRRLSRLSRLYKYQRGFLKKTLLLKGFSETCRLSRPALYREGASRRLSKTAEKRLSFLLVIWGLLVDFLFFPQRFLEVVVVVDVAELPLNTIFTEDQTCTYHQEKSSEPEEARAANL